MFSHYVLRLCSQIKLCSQIEDFLREKICNVVPHSSSLQQAHQLPPDQCTPRPTHHQQRRRDSVWRASWSCSDLRRVSLCSDSSPQSLVPCHNLAPLICSANNHWIQNVDQFIPVRSWTIPGSPLIHVWYNCLWRIARWWKWWRTWRLILVTYDSII